MIYFLSVLSFRKKMATKKKIKNWKPFLRLCDSFQVNDWFTAAQNQISYNPQLYKGEFGYKVSLIPGSMSSRALIQPKISEMVCIRISISA